MVHHRHAAGARRGSGSTETEVIRVWLLGGFRVSVGSRNIEAQKWRLRKAASLIKLLALAPGHALHRERVTDVLWPDLDAKSAANNLHRVLHTVRGALGDSQPAASRLVQLRGEMLVLCPGDQLWVDVEVFESAAGTARRSREPEAYRAAIELYAGELLPEDRYEEWTQQRREELRQSHLALLIELARVHEEREEYEPAIQALGRVAYEEPAREETHASLMRLYALSGRRHEAILQYERLREALREALGAQPRPASLRLYEEIRAGSLAAVPSPAGGRPPEPPEDPPRHNLPASLTSFVGREREMLEARRLLSMTRLLTLTGAGGSGKTRLALEVARGLLGIYPDGVWLVEFAPLSDPALVAKTLASVLDVREQAGQPVSRTLASHLSSRRTLLVLDNCEHVVEEAASLAEVLLKSCPDLKVLATSREPLGVPGETVWTVPPLSVPHGRATPESLIGTEAGRLFVDRARSRLPDFELTQDNAGAVARVCATLDGIPLAIELATARVGALAVEQIAGKLEDSLVVLVGGRAADPRQKTMTATLDWSYRLLDEAERKLLARLSVFAGGMTLEAIGRVCSDEGDEAVLDTTLRLVEKSLLLVVDSSGGAVRYRMLEPIRQYALGKLEACGELEKIRDLHAAYFLSLALEARPELVGPEPGPWLEALNREVGNLQVALSWTLDGEPDDDRVETGLRLANALARFWDTHSPAEGRRWFEKGLSRGVRLPPEVRAEALREAGFIAVYEWDPRSIQMLTEAFEIYKEIGDQADLLLTVEHLGHALAHHATPEVAAPILAEVEALLKDSGDPNIEAHYVNFLGFAAEVESNHEETRLRWKEALAIYRELGDIRNIARVLPSLGMVTLSHHDVEEAARYFEEGLAMVRDIRYKTVIFFHLMGLAAVAALRGQARRAAKLYGAGEALRETGGFSFSALASSEYDYESYLALVRAGLEDAEFEAAWSEGRRMPIEDAIEYALSMEDASAAGDTRDRAALAPLTRRERGVALLIGRGYTNRRIAEELGITERTVEVHVSKVLRKLGLRSRTQIATWIMRRGPGGVEDRES
jgi:predicted ATPase/DNA-binding SARP family transcriptional activator/DNA-binding CsgD family transcriptional regulator